MNIAFFLKPKLSVIFLYDDYSMRQALEKMRRCGYTAIPVVSRDGQYVGTVSEGDFLWYIIDALKSSDEMTLKMLENIPLMKIIKKDSYKPVKITEDVRELMNVAMNQNFVPVTDDLGSFIGIVTRRDIIKSLSSSEEKAQNVI